MSIVKKKLMKEFNAVRSMYHKNDAATMEKRLKKSRILKMYSPFISIEWKNNMHCIIDTMQGKYILTDYGYTQGAATIVAA